MKNTKYEQHVFVMTETNADKQAEVCYLSNYGQDMA